MRVGILYSGGKDSNLALYKASKHFEISCLINLRPESSDSAIFHYPCSDLVELQAKALEIPLVRIDCGDGEDEQLEALFRALSAVKQKYGIKGVVTGAVKSVYQASRFQAVCNRLGLWCFNPLWLMDEEGMIGEILSLGFKAIITRLAIYPFKPRFLGKPINIDFIRYLKSVRANLSGEGGEYETLVTWMPLFKKEVKIIEYEVVTDHNEGEVLVKKAELA